MSAGVESTGSVVVLVVVETLAGGVVDDVVGAVDELPPLEQAPSSVAAARTTTERAARRTIGPRLGNREPGCDRPRHRADPQARATTVARLGEEPTASGLTYVSDQTPGFGRRRAGRGFTYLDRRGSRITSARQIERIDGLAIPPAWTDVWICPDPNGHLQATGRDARGRKQYRYHPAWRVQQEEDKYGRLIDFGAALPVIRKQVAQDYRLPGIPRAKVLAAVVHLLESSLIRVGNDEYAKANGSFGLTTLRDRHVKFDAGDMRFSFSGKSGKDHTITVHDPRTARIVRSCRDIPGQRLFQYVDEEGKRGAVDSTDVNEYLRATTGTEFTAKDFRTWIGTLLAAVALESLDVPESDAEGRRNATLAITAVSKRLGNTPTVARNSYVHPDIVDLYLDGRLRDVWNRRPARDSRYFLAEEKRLVAVLKAAHRIQARHRAAARTQQAA